MLRQLIKSLIPNKGDIFFNLFKEGAANAHLVSKILVDILTSKDEKSLELLASDSKIVKQKSLQIQKQCLTALNNMFITPIDRADIQELSTLLNKITKRIVKVSVKLKIYSIDRVTDDCLIKSANTLLNITTVLATCIDALKMGAYENIVQSGEVIENLEENSIDDFREAINEIYSGKFDTLTILKLKEVYKSIDSAMELGVAAAELVLQISLKLI